MPTEIHDTLQPDPKAPARAREIVRGLAVPETVRNSVELIVSELVTNSIVHSEANAAVELRLRSNAKRVSGEVCDLGGGFSWEPEEPDLDEPGGLGLLVVDQLAAEWGVRRNGETCVWFECVAAEPH
jgi:anti-sigma regulatory factor (Ser/Thr protein kinase)